jgi:hypothetical protein
MLAALDMFHLHICQENEVCTNLSCRQCRETNVMHFLFDLLRIKSLYIFRALLANPKEALHKRHLVYCVRVMSVSCTMIGVECSNARIV